MMIEFKFNDKIRINIVQSIFIRIAWPFAADLELY